MRDDTPFMTTSKKSPKLLKEIRSDKGENWSLFAMISTQRAVIFLPVNFLFETISSVVSLKIRQGHNGPVLQERKANEYLRPHLRGNISKFFTLFNLFHSSFDNTCGATLSLMIYFKNKFSSMCNNMPSFGAPGLKMSSAASTKNKYLSACSDGRT